MSEFIDTQEDVDDIKKHLNFVRNGSCKRCGNCCYIWNGKESKERVTCKHLYFDGNGLAICDLGENKPAGCKAYPMRPHALGNDIDYFKDCGYIFTLRTDLTKQEMIDNLSYVCSKCLGGNIPIFCAKRQDLEDIINASSIE